MENKRSRAGTVALAAFGLFLMGSVAAAGLVPVLPEAFAQGTAQPAVSYNGPQVPKASFQSENGIPLGPPYGHVAVWQDEKAVAVTVAFAGLGVGVMTGLCLVRGRGLPVLKL